MARRGLYANINAKKKAGTSNTKKKSTISPEAYANMQAGFPNSKKNKAKKKVATAMYGGTMKKKKMNVGGKAKPDYIDLDKDGNKTESMKKASMDAKKPTKKMYGGSMKKPTKKMYGGKMHMNKKKGK